MENSNASTEVSAPLTKRPLGRTGLHVTLAGLGTGGPGKLGLSHGKTVDHAVALVRRALQRGVRLIDTAEYYRTEHVIAEAIEGWPRDELVLTSKIGVRWLRFFRSPGRVRRAVEERLELLRTDRLDVCFFHAIPPQWYRPVRKKLLPELLRLRDEGLIRHVGITERNATDHDHVMLKEAIDDDVWEVIMVALNIANPSALHTVLPEARRRGIGTLVMCPVRPLVRDPKVRGWLEAEYPGASLSDLIAKAYAFSRRAPHVDATLFASSNPEHQDQAIEELSRPANEATQGALHAS